MPPGLPRGSLTFQATRGLSPYSLPLFPSGGTPPLGNRGVRCECLLGKPGGIDRYEHWQHFAAQRSRPASPLGSPSTLPK